MIDEQQSPDNSPRSMVVRKIPLAQEGITPEYAQLTPAERILMVWPLTLTAWRFAKPNGFEHRLQRHVVRIERR